MSITLQSSDFDLFGLPERFEQDRELIPAGRLAELHFEKLVAGPGSMSTCWEACWTKANNGQR